MQQETHHITKDIEPSSAFWRWFFFLTGIVATIAYRITFLLDPLSVKVAWYIGTIGFALYFWHRSAVETKRAKLVKNYQLVESLEKSDIAQDQKAALLYLTKTNVSSKARFNSAFILWASVAAFFVAAAIDIFHIKIG